MVTRGQYLERPTLIPVGRGLVLEGVSHRGDRRPGLLVLPPPPAEGSGMDHVVAAELAFAASSQGHPTLRFNYRGVGGSQGKRSAEAEDWLEDARAALELARDNAGGTPPAVAALGASDAVAVRLAREGGICGLAFVTPSVLEPGDLVGLGLEVAVVLAAEDRGPAPAVWAAALATSGTLTVVPGTGRGFQRNLPLVGKAVAALLQRLGGVG